MGKQKETDGPPPLPWEDHAWNSPGEGLVYLARDTNPVVLLSSSASAQDLRSLDVEKETREAVEESSPRGVLEDGLRSFDSETNSSKTSTSYTGPQANQSSRSQWRGFLRLWRQKSIRRLSTFPPIGTPKLLRRRSNKEDHVPSPNLNTDAHCSFFKPSWKSFTINELQKATNNFNSENVIGKGGYAEVYKGCLEDGQLVAIKRLNRGTAEEQISNFLSELGIIVHINHPNAAKLIGFGVEEGMHLVLQLSQNGSLASLLHGSGKKLEWGIRIKVAIGTAEGLEYLHEKCKRRIIHRDIKAANILLTEEFESQICDFGLAKWLPDQWTHHNMSSFEGTFGYLAPEYFMHGIVDEKTDVFAFGVLLLELITGREAVDSSQHSLVIWAKPFLEKNDFIGLIDPSLGDAYDYTQLKCAALTASMCIQQSSILRPRMSQVVKLLKGDESAVAGKLPHRPLLRRTFSEELFDAEEYNATRYLSDLNQYKLQALQF